MNFMSLATAVSGGGSGAPDLSLMLGQPALHYFLSPNPTFS